MSFQGPGTGLTGTAASLTAGYAQSAGNINGYAPSAGSATNINSANGINGSSWAWSGQPGTPGWLWGANVAGQYAVWQPANITVGTANYTNGNIGGYAPQAGYANQAAAYTNGNIGGRAPVATYADYAGGAGNINGYAPSAGSVTNAYGGQTKAWAFSTNGNSAGVSQFQQGSTFGTPCGYVTFNISLGYYYGIMAGIGQWNGYYQARIGAAGSSAILSGWKIVG
jgi:hypothetical protein